MTNKKEKRRKKEKKQQKKNLYVAQQTSRRRDTYRKILNLAGADQYLLKLPRDLPAFIYGIAWPNLHINIEATKIPHIAKTLQTLQTTLKGLITEAGIDIDSVKVRLSDISAIYGLQQIFHSLYSETKDIRRSSTKPLIGAFRRNIRQEVKADIGIIEENTKHILNCLNAFVEKHEKSLVEKLLSTTYEEIMKHFHYLNGLYPIIGLSKDQSGRIRPVIKIRILDSKLINIQTKTEIRKAHRCYAASHPEGIVPVTWKPNIVGNAQPLNVYIQDHALSRIRERLNISPSGYVYDCIGRSMSNPVIVGMSGPSYMVEYKYFSYRLGYLIVTIEDDIALVRSFKFITMTGTPEFYALKNRLKGSREDFEYLGLDTLDMLLNSDIQNDPQLREIFIDCGLGHLFDLTDPEFGAPKKLIAEELKQYFRLRL